LLSNPSPLLSKFLVSRKQGLSRRTIQFYYSCLNRASSIIGTDTKAKDIKQLLDSLTCSNGGKHAYYRALRAFYNWLYSPKSEMELNTQDNPMLLIEPPKVEKQLLPALTNEQVNQLIERVDSLRDKAIISLFADSGVRLNELTNIQANDINWTDCTITMRRDERTLQWVHHEHIWKHNTRCKTLSQDPGTI